MGFPDIPLGSRMHAFGVVLRGKNTKGDWLSFVREIAVEIGMQAVAAPAMWTYPVEGKGGNGQTIILPITESFIAIDTWKDHNGAYLFICSCKKFNVSSIESVAERFGLYADCDWDGCFKAELRLA